MKKGSTIDVIGLQDLVQSKKTQRDKDWLMLKRLVENDIILSKNKQPTIRVKWWLEECRDAGLLIALAKKYHKVAKERVRNRRLLSLALAQDTEGLKVQLADEENIERQKDIEYWAPLRKELETLRHSKRSA